MAGGMKIPWSRRDTYRYYAERDEVSDLRTVESNRASSCEAINGLEKGRNEPDAAKNTSNRHDHPKSTQDNGHSESQMVPLVAPTRCKSRTRKEQFFWPESNGKGPTGGEGDFVDMPTTREYIEGGVPVFDTAELDYKDELDSPTKLTDADTSREKLTKTKNTKRSPSKQPSRDHIDLDPGQAAFTWCDVIIYVVSIGSYVFDVGSDCFVAYMYYTGKHWMWFGLTVAFITVPSIVMTAFSLKWYIVDHKHDKMNKRKPASLVRWVSRFAFLLFQVSPMLRYIDSLIYGCKSRRFKHPEEHKAKLHWYHMMLYEDTDSAMLRLIECFMEAAPQLVLQLYIMCVLGSDGGVVTVVGQIVASLTSLCSLAWSLAAYHKALRASLPEKEKMTYFGMALQFLWRFFLVAARVIALALFASRFKAWVFMVIASHWMTMFTWIRLMQTTFCENRAEELGFNLVSAAIYVFCYLNLVEGHTRVRYLFYYIITFAEDAVLISTWYALTQTKYIWYQNPAICAVFLGYVLGIFFQVLYYLKAHPNNFAEDKSKAIRAWIPIKELWSERHRPTPQRKLVPVQLNAINASIDQIPPVVVAPSKNTNTNQTRTASPAPEANSQGSPLVHAQSRETSL